MSYGFKVKFVEGEAVAYDTYGEPPTDGELVLVSGHTHVNTNGRDQESIGVSLIDKDTKLVVSANAVGLR